MTWQAQLSWSSTDQDSAATLLGELLPLNATGYLAPVSAHDGWLVLNTTQVELLGFSPNALTLVPWVVPLSQQTPSGSPPQSLLSEATQWVSSAISTIADSLVAFANFLVTVAVEIAERVGQWIVGAFEAAASAVTKAVNEAVSAIEALANAIVSYMTTILTQIFSPVTTAFSVYVSALLITIVTANDTLQSGDLVNSNEGLTFWQAFSDGPSNPLVVAAISATAAFMIAGVLMTTFGGVVPVAPWVAQLVITIVLGGLTTGAYLAYGSAGVSSLASSLVYAVELFFNTTGALHCAQPSWDLFAELFKMVGDLESVGGNAILAFAALVGIAGAGPLLGSVFSFVLAVIAAGLVFVAHSISGWGERLLTLLSAILGVPAIVGLLKAYFGNPEIEDPTLSLIDYATMGLGLFTEATDLYTLGSGC